MTYSVTIKGHPVTPMDAKTQSLISAAAAIPHTHEVVVTYADGRERRLATRSEATAESHAAHAERHKIGRDLLDPETKKTVRVVSVSVRPLPDRAELMRRKITTLDEGKAWIRDLIALDLMFHFDDDPETIVEIKKDDRTFSDAEAASIRLRLDELYGLDFEGAGGCPIGYALILQEGEGWGR